jgi:hypothetical protein
MVSKIMIAWGVGIIISVFGIRRFIRYNWERWNKFDLCVDCGLILEECRCDRDI